MYTLNAFLEAVLPSAGFPCVGTLSAAPPTPGKKRVMHHSVYPSVALMEAALTNADYESANYYFCISTLEQQSIVQGCKTRVRVQENALWTKCFVVDIDIRPDEDGHYATKEEGLEGLAKLCGDLNMPQPIVVDSGFGFHCYWPMEAAIDSKRWRIIARRFLAAAQLSAPGVVADSSRVCDTSGVLRIPGSYNHKTTPGTPVKIIQWFSAPLDLAQFSNQIGITAADFGAAVDPKVGITLGDTANPKPLTAVAKNCNWTREYIKSAATASEPEWYAMLGMAPYLYHDGPNGLIEKEGMAHLLSKAHPEYNHEDTARKYTQAMAGQTGPTTCARFESVMPSRCVGCPFRGGVKTPLSTADLDRPATGAKVVETTTVDEAGNKAVETVTVPEYPKPYFRGESGGVYVRVPGDEGGFAKIYDYDVYATKRFRTEGVESEQLEIHFWLPKDGLRKVKMPTEVLVDHKKLGAYLAGKGMVTEYGKSQGLAKYMTNYARYLQQQASAETEFSRLGWRDVNSATPKFVVGNGYYDETGELNPGTYASFLKDAAKAAASFGSLDEWKKAFSVYSNIPNSEAFQLAALIGFAAPLLALTEYSGVLYNIVGHSAAGKSTALKFMTSVWGQPNSNHILHTDTQISMFNMIGYLSSIPVAFDEVTKMDGDAVSDFVLSFTSGRGKMRATRDGQNRLNSMEWDTIVCSTSNTSLYDKLSAARKGYSAEAMRVFEVNVGESSPKYKYDIDRALTIIRENYGLAGREYIKYVMPRAAALRKAVDAASTAITKRGTVRNEERFWVALLACVQVGGLVSRKLGLHEYDATALVEWAMGGASVARQTVRNTITDPISVMSEFFNANLHSLVTIVDGQCPVRLDSIAPRDIKARLEYEGDVLKEAWVSAQMVRKYCTDNRVDAAWLQRELTDAGILMGTGTKRLAAGTKLVSSPVQAWQLNMQHPLLAIAADAVKPEETK